MNAKQDDAADRPTCVATARYTGQRCKRWPIPGGTVCILHGGGTPQVRRKAAVRVALREALERGDRRPVWEILLDTVHSADVLMRDVRASLGEDGTVTPEQLDRFVEAMERAAKLARTAIDARAHEMIAQRMQLEGEAIARVITTALTRVLDALGMDSGLRVKIEGYAREVVSTELRRADGETVSDAEPPRLGVVITEIRDEDILPPHEPGNAVVPYRPVPVASYRRSG